MELCMNHIQIIDELSLYENKSIKISSLNLDQQLFKILTEVLFFNLANF